MFVLISNEIHSVHDVQINSTVVNFLPTMIPLISVQPRIKKQNSLLIFQT